MITIIPSPRRKRPGMSRGFTLVELLIGMTLASLGMLGVLSSFLFMGRTAVNLRNYSDMEAQSRKALELFAEDTRQASAIVWNSGSSITLTVEGTAVTYAYSSGVFSRTKSGQTTKLITGITVFSFLAYTINGTKLENFSTPAELATAGLTTKQLQLSITMSRSPFTVTTSTNLVISARYVLRNKTVTV